MINTPQQALILSAALGFVVMVVFLVGLIINGRKKLVSQRKLYYFGVPLSLIPVAFVATFIVWPVGSLNFAVRILITFGITIVSIIPIFLFVAPFIEWYLRSMGHEKSEDDSF